MMSLNLRKHLLQATVQNNKSGLGVVKESSHWRCHHHSKSSVTFINSCYKEQELTFSRKHNRLHFDVVKDVCKNSVLSSLRRCHGCLEEQHSVFTSTSWRMSGRMSGKTVRSICLDRNSRNFHVSAACCRRNNMEKKQRCKRSRHCRSA